MMAMATMTYNLTPLQCIARADACTNMFSEGGVQIHELGNVRHNAIPMVTRKHSP